MTITTRPTRMEVAAAALLLFLAAAPAASAQSGPGSSCTSSVQTTSGNGFIQQTTSTASGEAADGAHGASASSCSSTTTAQSSMPETGPGSVAPLVIPPPVIEAPAPPVLAAGVSPDVPAAVPSGVPTAESVLEIVGAGTAAARPERPDAALARRTVRNVLAGVVPSPRVRCRRATAARYVCSVTWAPRGGGSGTVTVRFVTRRHRLGWRFDGTLQAGARR